MEGRESSDCLLVATRIDADRPTVGIVHGDWRFVATRIDAVKRSPTSADTADCVRGEVSLPVGTLTTMTDSIVVYIHFPKNWSPSWRLNTQSLRNPVLVSSSIIPRIQTSRSKSSRRWFLTD